MQALLRLLTFWSFAILISLLAFEAAPATGGLIDGFGVPYVTGWLFHIALVATMFEGLAGRFSRFVIILPLLFYSGYFIAYWRQGEHIANEATLLKAENPTKILDFNPAKFSLVMDRAEGFVATHQIPVAYAYESSYRPSEYLSYRLMSTAQVWAILGPARTDVRVLGVNWDNAKQPQVLEIQAPQRPANEILSVTVTDDPGAGWNAWNIGVETTEISRGGEKIGRFRSAYVERLPKFPFLTIGCSPSAGPSRRICEANFIVRRQAIDSTPDSVDQAKFDDPVSIMLGLRKYADADYANFQGFAANRIEASRPAHAPEPDEEAALAALQAIVDGQSPFVAWTMGDAIASHPKRLANLAARMAKRFVELNQPEALDAPERREQATLLADGLAALASKDFAAVADPLSGIVRREGAWQDFPVLYVRLAEAGPHMFSFYRDRFLARDVSRQEKLLAALAICRIGQADGELGSAMKDEWVAATATGKRDVEYKSALFVTLLKLGQEDFLREAILAESVAPRAWYEAVLAGRGKTELGPNNCMPTEWPRAEYIPKGLAPRLRWSGEQWVEQYPK